MEAGPDRMETRERPSDGYWARTARRGDPFVWMTGGALALALLMIGAILILIAWHGVGAMWPERLVRFEFADGSVALGSVREVEPDPEGPGQRVLLRISNRDLYGIDFKWFAADEGLERSLPRDAWLVSRYEWGPFFGYVEELRLGETTLTGRDAEDAFPREIEAARGRRAEIVEIERTRIAAVNRGMEQYRLRIRELELSGKAESPQAGVRRTAYENEISRLEDDYAELMQILQNLRRTDEQYRVVLRSADDRTKEIPLSQVVKAFRPNALGLAGSVGIFLGNLWEFVSADPRESNTEGGVFPAIFGTVLMTLLMTVAVVPLGVLAAIYLREYAKQGPLVSAVRVAVNNLAGVPSIVFGVFGLGFFVYLIGGSIDQLFYPERLPNPTFGGGGILWASLTLALLTVPVVIVSTEEALAAVPAGIREGSVACGASKFQTLWRIVLPSAAPGVMTGTILAMARGAGEVAPLMITGVVKLAPTLPVDGQFPFLHLERRFMHLGFHVYDVGFQSPNVEAAKPMVYATALLLIVLVVLLNLAAIVIRSRLRRQARGSGGY